MRFKEYLTLKPSENWIFTNKDGILEFDAIRIAGNIVLD